MRQAPPTRDRRGFTLVELLVVMVIIAILIGLALSGVQRVRARAKELKVRSDISQLQSAIQSFKSNKQVSYVPSRIRLRNNLADYSNPVDQLDTDSLAYLKKVWPRLPSNGAVFDQSNPNLKMRSRGWFPDDPNASLNRAYELQGWQCLVFFLGGIQYNGGCFGFSTNPANPTMQMDPNVGQPTFRMEAPTFDFPTDRLTYVSGSFAPYGFTDPYGVVYAYFTSYYGNDYLRYATLPFQFANPPVPNPGNNGYSDCGSLIDNNGVAVYPYFELNGTLQRFYNREGFQIICAGKNTLFGNGGPWSAAAGYPPGSNGEDDFSNFHATNLGTGTAQ